MRLHGFLIGQTETLLADVLKLAGPADAATSRFFRAHPKLGHGERGVIAEAVFAVLRRRMEFAHLAESGTGSPARRMALLGLMQTAGPLGVETVRLRYRVQLARTRREDRPGEPAVADSHESARLDLSGAVEALRGRRTGAARCRTELPGAAGPAR